jgi:hypothetical protein
MTIEKLAKIKDLLDRSDARINFYLIELGAEYRKNHLEMFLFYSANWHMTRIENAKAANKRIHSYYRKSLVKFLESELR